MRQWTRSSLVQIMACRLFGAKPLSEAMLTYCQLDPKQYISMKCFWKSSFCSRKCIWKHCLQNGSLDLVLRAMAVDKMVLGANGKSLHTSHNSPGYVKTKGWLCKDKRVKSTSINSQLLIQIYSQDPNLFITEPADALTANRASTSAETIFTDMFPS